MFSVENGDISVCQMMFASFPEYSIIIACQMFSVENGDISVCDDLDLDQMVFVSFPDLFKHINRQS